jgi:esterase/lipase superfamily enzyme
MPTRHFVTVLLSALLTFVWADSLCAQQRELVGTVRDSAGATLPGVTVELVRGNTVVQTVTTNDQGAFRIPVPFQLDASYAIRVLLRGFAPAAVALKADQETLEMRTAAFQVQGRFMVYAPASRGRGSRASPPPPAPPPPTPPPTATVPPTPTLPDETHALVPVFYATDRERLTEVAYGPKRNPEGRLRLGRFDVSIPRDVHQAGRLERPTLWTFHREDPDKHFVIVSRVEQTYDEFYRQLSGIVAKSGRKQVLVFIHGYNVSFEDAVYRTAQISYDLNFDGGPILYSWPSEGALTSYPTDANNAEWTVPHLRWFLEDVATKTQAEEIQVIAHSMGNRPLMSAMNQISSESSLAVRSRFREVVLTAPDIDADVFKRLATALRQTARHVTLYASSNDLALKASRDFQGYQRAGDTQPAVVVVDGIETIDVSALDTGFLGHSYFADRRSVLADLFYVLRDGLHADERAGLDTSGQPPRRYWIFRR